MTELHRQVKLTGFLALVFAATLAPTRSAQAQEVPEETVPANTLEETPPPAGQDGETDPIGGETDPDDGETDPANEESDGGGDAGVDDRREEGSDAELARPTGETESDRSERYPSDHFGHRLQVGLSALVGVGYQFDVAYGGDHCNMGDGTIASVCNHRSPMTLDIQLSFGITEGLEILAEYRLGLIEETFLDGSRSMAAGLGIRYFISPLNRFKFFIGALLDIDFTQGLDLDVFLRPIFGLQIEIVRWVAFFIQASVNLSFIRSFGISLDGGAGIQIRFP